MTVRKAIARSGPIGVLGVAFLGCLGWLSLARLILVALYWSRVSDTDSLSWVFVVGLRMDVILLCQLFAIPAALYLLLPGKIIRESIVRVWLTAAAAVLVYMELSTPSFINEFDNRPDRIFYEYLLYPREVLGTLLKTYPLQLVAVTALVGLAAFVFHRVLRNTMRSADTWTWSRRAAILPLVVVFLFLGIRSTLGHRPANLSTAAFSTNHLVNELAVNSTYSLFTAIYMTRSEVSAAKMYGEMPWPEVLARVRRASLLPTEECESPAIPTLHRQTPHNAQSKPPNVVIVVMESLGADFVGALGGLPLTPNIDRLADQGLWFTQLYATGTRTVRGLEAVVTGFPPTAAPSVLKLPASQRSFFTLGQLLKREGYATDFIYGGVSNFDNMGKFFRDNGVERIIEQKDFQNPELLGTWGVSDEDLVTKAHQAFLAHGEKPFFSLLLTTSNHVPFEFPPDRIEPYDQPLASRNNAVKYTDYAVGKLFELARSAPYYENTIFLVVADHDARVYGADLVPVSHFRIPGVIIGPGVPKRREDRIASQIDLAPTLLSLLGIDAPQPMIGRSLSAQSDGDSGRAIMQYADVNGYRVGDKVAIHQPGKPARTFRYVDGRLQIADHDGELEKDALAHLLWADRSYRERLYRLPETE